MSIERLIDVVPPPAEPFEAFSGPWEKIEAELITILPQDYKDFVRVYGSGYFMEFLGIDVPRSRNRNTRLEVQVAATRRVFSHIHGEEWPYPFWPDQGGLMSFGGTDNGDYLFWLTRGSPEDWRVVVWGRFYGGFEPLDCNLTDFLAGLAMGEILPEAFPGDLVVCDHLFQPRSVAGELRAPQRGQPMARSRTR